MKKTKKTIIFHLADCVGRKTFLESSISNKFKILDLIGDTSYQIITRKRTPKELDDLGKKWEEEGHLLSKEEYIKRIKNETITEPNLNYPHNVIKTILNHAFEYDIIFVKYNSKIIETLSNFKEYYIENVFVYPNKNYLCDYIGRLYLSDSNSVIIRFAIKNWDKLQTMYTSTHCYNSKHFSLKANEYLSDVIRELYPDLFESEKGKKFYVC